MILLYTDFGYASFYVGQLKSVLTEHAPGVPVIDLMHDAPLFDPCSAGYLLAALAPHCPSEAVILAVVDPGVGGTRRPLVVRADKQVFVGPDNGLFELVLRRAEETEIHSIDWQPEELSASFHGRDLFAPVAAALARGATYGGTPLPADAARRPEWPDDLPYVIHIDGFGNLITGIRAIALPSDTEIHAGEFVLTGARTFGDVPPGTAFWYENSVGLVEIAVNQGNAAHALGLPVGTPITVDQPETVTSESRRSG